MTFLLTTILPLFIFSTHAQQFSVIRKIPNATMSSDTNQFTLEIDRPVNPPAFRSLIHIMNATSNSSIYALDASGNTSNVTYVNRTVSFSLPNTTKWDTNTVFYIALDDGVLFSNASLNSSGQTDPQFWSVKVIGSNSNVGFTMMSIISISDTTPLSTLFAATSGPVMSSTGGTLPVVTSMPPTSAMNTQTGATVYATNTTATPGKQGEPSPTRSAQWGMGIGITFISVIVVVEVIYFKYCYTNYERSGSYNT